MPYINEKNREALDPAITRLVDELDKLVCDDGDVNYTITKIITACYPPISYMCLNKAMGVLESVKQEFYRRVVAPYEDKKRAENGDVF